MTPRFVPVGATPRSDQDIRDRLKIGDPRLRVISEALAEYDLVTLSGLSDEVTRVWEEGSFMTLVVETKSYGTFRLSNYLMLTPTVEHLTPTP